MAVGSGGALDVAIWGRYSVWAVALEFTLIDSPPKTAERSEVTRRNVPRTVTVAVLPAALAQGVGRVIEQVLVMSVEAIGTYEPFDANWTRQTTVLLTASHGPSWMNVPVFEAACIAPSRAALFRLMLA